MKATGIVRRIDDLGRVVIPKEIRRTLRIRETDPLEIYVERNGEIILKKYSPMKDLRDFSDDYAQTMAQSMNATILISDRDEILSASGTLKSQFNGKKNGSFLLKLLEDRTFKESFNLSSIEITSNQETELPSYLASPIFSNGDAIGVVMAIGSSETKLTENDRKTIEIASSFLGKRMEI